MADSNCIYCGSQSYGRPCTFSPTNTHVHMDLPQKCIYCGSQQLGSGCPWNPYGSQHVRGPEFLNRSAVQTEKASLLTYFFNIASKTLEEGSTYSSPLDRLYKRMSGMIASVTEPLLEAFCLQNTPNYGNLSKKELISTIDFRKKFEKNITDLSKTIDEAAHHLPQEIVEKTLLDAIMNLDVRKNKN